MTVISYYPMIPETLYMNLSGMVKPKKSKSRLILNKRGNFHGLNVLVHEGNTMSIKK